ncbi:MAG TPA: hypothetical protein VFK70_02330 [Vicinamibacteria bacterium]|nr:hypothetical protein [Vicinamibacteria bacterium]
MKKAVLALAVAGMLGMGGGSVRSADTADVTLAGEVVDLHCYLTRGAAGSEHAGCANACIGRGVTPGFLADDGRVFVLLGERPFPVKEQIAGLAGEKVTVTGTPVERGGVRALQLKLVKRSDPAR